MDKHLEAKGMVTQSLFVQQAMIWMRKNLLWNTFAIGVCVFGIFGLAMGRSLSAVWTLMLLGMIAYAIFMTIIFQRNFRNQYDQTPFMQEEQHFIFKTQEMCRYIRNGQQCWEWKELTKIVETEDGFRIHPAPKQIIVVPKLFFSSQEDIKHLRHLMDSHFYRTKNHVWERHSAKN